MSVSVNPKQVIASEDVVVHDENLKIDRKLFAGQPVPPDLVEAYQAKVGNGRKSASGGGAEKPDYAKQNNDDLEAEIKKRGLDVPTEGTGQDGRVVKKDLVAILEKSDAASGGDDS